jgi:hypothetical protein
VGVPERKGKEGRRTFDGAEKQKRNGSFHEVSGHSAGALLISAVPRQEPSGHTLSWTPEHPTWGEGRESAKTRVYAIDHSVKCERTSTLFAQDHPFQPLFLRDYSIIL